MTLLAAGCVNREDVLPAVELHQHASFGDGTGLWADMRDVARDLGHYGSGRILLDDLAREGKARRHPSGADFWQVVDAE